MAAPWSADISPKADKTLMKKQINARNQSGRVEHYLYSQTLYVQAHPLLNGSEHGTVWTIMEKLDENIGASSYFFVHLTDDNKPIYFDDVFTVTSNPKCHYECHFARITISEVRR